MPRGENFEIIPPEEDITNGKISMTGDQYNLVVANNDDPENISSWITNKSGDRKGSIARGNDGLEAKKVEFNKLEIKI